MGEMVPHGEGFNMNLINREQYPQLNQILWDNHAKLIEPERALQAYESRWRYIDEQDFLADEKKLLQQLIAEYGNGLFLTA